MLVSSINADLSAGDDLTTLLPLPENHGIAYQGPVKVGHFEVDPDVARKMLAAPINPNGLPNSDVVVPWIIARDLADRAKGMYIVDFQNRTEAEAALYEMPFEYIRSLVYPSRLKNNRLRRREYWWQHGEKNFGMRKALQGLRRYIATPRVSKHRFFTFVSAETLADSRVVVIARDDLYFIGILESLTHKVWSLKNSSRHGVGNDITYNIETCFDTFPFPWPPGTEPSEAEDARVKAIADAARELVRLRDAWLNPPGISSDELKSRTLTNLYNQRFEWLANAHRALDEAVFAAYGWPSDLPKEEILARLLALNHERAAAQAAGATAE
jgi:type II restriction/modification system DNA methylase subunit YeeA